MQRFIMLINVQNRTVSFENKGVLVAGVAKGMPSEGKLKLGDVIIDRRRKNI